eukprot:121414-Rhodomonas_salina.1
MVKPLLEFSSSSWLTSQLEVRAVSGKPYPGSGLKRPNKRHSESTLPTLQKAGNFLLPGYPGTPETERTLRKHQCTPPTPIGNL